MKSGRVKNQCKICSETVNKKKGVQCMGACKKWAHYKCLDFSPDQIKNAKNGSMKITCPCPDCNVPETYKCCSAKNTGTSVSGLSAKPIPYPPKFTQPISYPPPSTQPYTNEAIPVTHTSCGGIFDDLSLITSKLSLLPRTTTGSTSPQLFMASPPTKMFRSKKTSPKDTPESSQCAPYCPNRNNHYISASAPASSSSSGSGINIKWIPRRSSNSDSKLPSNKKELYTNLDEMCKTVEKLSIQLRELMFKMIESKKIQ